MALPPASIVTETLTKIRFQVGNETPIIMMIPLSGKGRTELTAAFTSYKSLGSGDENAYLVDLGNITYATADGQHPTAAGHRAVYRAALPKFDPIIQLSR
jgi:hypothetical protein